MSMLELNKEFLSYVLSLEGNIINIEKRHIAGEFHGEYFLFNISDKNPYSGEDEEYEMYINKYELMHMIKQRALVDYNHIIQSYIDISGFGVALLVDADAESNEDDLIFGELSELEAVYKAGLYVWERKNENK